MKIGIIVEFYRMYMSLLSINMGEVYFVEKIDVEMKIFFWYYLE